MFAVTNSMPRNNLPETNRRPTFALSSGQRFRRAVHDRGSVSGGGRSAKALSRAKLVHRFEVYDEHDEIVGYFHYGWPRKDA